MAEDTDQSPVGLGQLQPILDVVSQQYKIPVAILRGAGQTSTVLEARQLCCWIACKTLRLSKEEIGRVFGRGKTSVGLAVASIERLRANEPAIANMIDGLLAGLRGGA